MNDLKTNKTIWMYWNKGIENAPYLVKLCAESWKIHNNNWDLIVLTDEKLSQYCDISDILKLNPKITIQALSDIIRVRLIHRFGGLWVDSTCFCNKPLDEWIYNNTVDDLFFFKAHNELEVFASWFIYAQKENYLISKLKYEQDRYFSFGNYQHYMNIRYFWRIFKKIETSLEKNNYFFWRSKIYRKYFGASPYFWFHYLLGYLINSDQKAKKIYEELNFMDDSRPHDFQIYGLSKKNLPQWIIDDFKNKKIPVYKMSYKRDVSLWERNGTFTLLEESLRN